jgi:hypothetical protein
MISTGSLCVRPDTIVFRDLEQGESDSIEIWARNVGCRPIVVRFSLPENSPSFVLVCKSNILTAPGLDAHAVVHYTASAESEGSTLRISCQDATVVIPITAYPPSPAIQVDRTRIDFGTVVIHSSQIQHFELKNCGTAGGNLTIRCVRHDVNIDPESSVLLPNGTVKASVSFCQSGPADSHCGIVPIVQGNIDKIGIIEGLATVVDHSIVVRNVDNLPITEVEFGSLFFGQKRSVKVRLSNKGAIGRTF